ncbi:MAG: hypothetical protein JNM00_03310 [Flavobacteriales bacterium]|nr:hypothetical protein [Flavobacteriales bacterium]
MKNFSLIISAMALVLASCGDKTNTATPSATEAASNQPATLFDLAGQYDGTLTCEGCGEIRSALMIQPDSTFQIRNSVNVNGKDSLITIAGSIQLTDGLKTLSLVGANAEAWTVSVTDGTHITLSSASAGTGALERKTKLVSTDNNRRLSYWLSAPDSLRAVQVYQEARNFVNIHKNFLDNAPDDQKALVAFYAEAFSAGCNGNVCDLVTALGFSQRGSEDHKSMVRAKVSTDSAMVKWGELSNGSAKLASLSLSRQPGTDMVRVSTMIEKLDGTRVNVQDMWKSNGGLLSLTESRINQIGTAPGPSVRVPVNKDGGSQKTREQLMKEREQMLKDRENKLTPPATREKQGAERQVQQRSAGGK